MRLMDRILAALSPDIRQRVMRWAILKYPLPALTSTERSRLHRATARNDKGNASVAAKATPALQQRNENVAAKATPALQQRNENVASPPHTPPTPHATKQAFSYSGGFSEFWRFYPKRVGKGEAYKTWTKSNCEVISEVVVKAVREQNGFLIREGGKYTPLPATWLNQRRWEDEPPQASPLSPKTQANAEALRRAAIRLKGGDPDAP